MRSKLKFLLFYFLSWVVFFQLMRLVFLAYHFDKTKALPFPTILGTAWHGLRMDLSVAAYILLPVGLFVLLSLFLRFFQRLLAYKIYTIIILFLVALITLADLEIYNAWGFRLDATPLRFLATPREALASVSHLPLFFIALVFILCYALFYFCFRYILRRIFFQQQHRLKIATGIVLLAVMAALIIPIRGGLQLAPLNQSSVYFSTRQFANHAAINVSWNLLHSVLSKENTTVNPYKYLSAAEAKATVDSLYSHGNPPPVILRNPTDTPLNVIMVVWESFTEKAIHETVDGVEATPQFNRLRQEGIFFGNAYASGDRTNKGIPAILSGYPAMPNSTIIHSPGKSAKLKVLSQLFREKGYASPFFYGGEPEFANIKSYLLHGGFDPIIGRDDFDEKDMNSKWGAHDGVVAMRVMSELNKTRQPFFATWLTLTSHEPYDTPDPPVIKGSDHTFQFLNSIHYTDKVLGQFIEECKKAPWWNHTVIIITGDHGHPLPKTGFRANDFRIPILWLGGALKQKGITIDKTVSQLDIAATLAQQAGLDATAFPFSRNLFDPAVKPWAFFTFNDGFGFMNGAGRLLYDNVGKRIVQTEGNVSPKEEQAGKAMMQVVYDDFINK